MSRHASILAALVALVVVATLAPSAEAQDGPARRLSERDEKEEAGVVAVSHGFGRFEDGTLQLSGGGEIYWPGGIGAGFELGYLSTGKGLDEGFLALSPSLLYRFEEVGQMRPYLRAGYTMVPADGLVHLAHFGGGANFRLSDRLGVQLEARDYLFIQAPGSQFLEIRLGLVIWER